MSDLFREALRSLSSEPQKEKDPFSDFVDGARLIMETVNQEYLGGIGSLNESDVLTLVWYTEDVNGTRLSHSICIKYEPYNAKNRGPAYELFFGTVQVGSGSITKNTWRTQLENLIIESIAFKTPTATHFEHDRL